MSLKPGHWNRGYESERWEHDIPKTFADLAEVIEWCQREFDDYETCMNYYEYLDRIHFVFKSNERYVAFLLRWA